MGWVFAMMRWCFGLIGTGSCCAHYATSVLFHIDGLKGRSKQWRSRPTDDFQSTIVFVSELLRDHMYYKLMPNFAAEVNIWEEGSQRIFAADPQGHWY